MKLFDSLVHATPDGGWISPTPRRAAVETLLHEMDLGGVERACLVAIDDVVESEFVRQTALTHPTRFVPVAGFNPAKSKSPQDTINQIHSFADQGFRGIKLHPRLNRYDPLDERCLAAIQAAGAIKLVVFLDTLFDYLPTAPVRTVAEVSRILGYHFPTTKIILLHGGGASILSLFDPVRHYKNLILDLSFTLFRYQESSVDLDLRFLFKHLDQRTVLGSDFPEHLPTQLQARIEELTTSVPHEKLERVLFKNLEQLFAK